MQYEGLFSRISRWYSRVVTLFSRENAFGFFSSAVPTNLREHPVFSAQVFSFTRQEKPRVKLETWAEKTGCSRTLRSHLHLNFWDKLLSCFT